MTNEQSKTTSDYSLYIHIPFCRRKCSYCDFTSYDGSEHLIPSYLESLSREIRTYSSLLGRPELKSVYFGGGTPSLLDPRDVDGILALVRDGFVLPEGTEVSMEVNPGTVNLAKLTSLRASGLNRLSIGAQSFNDNTLKRLGRIHTASQISYTYSNARTAGFDNINLDLMFALPSEELPDWQNSLSRAISMRPEHISTYNLVIEEGTPFHRMREELDLPTDDEEYEMFDDAISTLSSSGFEHYEISNFAKPGRRCRNNLTYWKNEEYIGVGAGATSYISPSRFSNPESIGDYVQQWAREDEDIILTKHKDGSQDLDQALSETFFLGLRLTEGIEIKKLLDDFGKKLDRHRTSIDELKGLKLIEETGGRIRLTRKGLFLANEVFEKFI